MGAVTVALRRRTGIAAASDARVADITMSSSYATGGDTFTVVQFDLFGGIDVILFAGGSGYLFEADLTNKKIKAFQRGAITENVAGAYTQNAVLAAVALAEVANATNLSAITVRAVVFGNNGNV